MKATFTLSNLTASFLESLEAVTAKEAFTALRSAQTGGLGHAIKLKIGAGDMRDAVAFNDIAKSATASWSFKIEPRRGYKLATFNVSA